jgi:hypothetical protein
MEEGAVLEDSTQKISMSDQIRACLANKYWIVYIIFFS